MSHLHRYAVMSSARSILERLCPGQTGPIFPEEGYPYELQVKYFFRETSYRSD